jgi:hypothetical protein
VLSAASQPANLGVPHFPGATRIGEHVVLRSDSALHVCNRQLVPVYTISLSGLGRPISSANQGDLLVPASWYTSLAGKSTTQQHRTAVGLVRPDGSVAWERESPWPGGGLVMVSNGLMLTIVRGESRASVRLVVLDLHLGTVVQETGDLQLPNNPPGPAGPSLAIHGDKVLLFWGRSWTLFSVSGAQEAGGQAPSTSQP